MEKTKKQIKGFKIFNKDLKCRGMQFEIGKTFTHEGDPVLCEYGFHFHEDPRDLFEVSYSFDPEQSRVCEIQVLGKVVTGDNKSVTNKIKILRELSWQEILNIVNIGKGNTGRRNTGYRNSGDSNSGYRNSGNRNSGDSNSGYRNSGYSNSGDSNSGYRNSGDSNSGYSNSGDSNSGDSNSGYRNSGIFNKTNYCSGIYNSTEQPIPLFNGAATVLMSEFKETAAYNILVNRFFPLTEWIDESSMTDDQKKENPKFYVMGGFLKVNTYEHACQKWWEELSTLDKTVIRNIPGFSEKVFTEVTGIKL
jgi:hypothetical protein